MYAFGAIAWPIMRILLLRLWFWGGTKKDIDVGNYYTLALVFHKKTFDVKNKVQWMEKWLMENYGFAEKNTELWDLSWLSTKKERSEVLDYFDGNMIFDDTKR